MKTKRKPKAKKKWFKLLVKVKARDPDKLPDWGLGRGVLMIRRVGIDLRNIAPMQKRQLMEQVERVIHETVECEIVALSADANGIRVKDF